jgi:hypothetical protein
LVVYINNKFVNTLFKVRKFSEVAIPMHRRMG